LARSKSRICQKEKAEAAANLNIPNALTALRVLLAPVIALLLLEDDRLRNSMAAGAIGLAAMTDFLDGYVARRQGKETKLGQFLDPLADKICLSTAFVTLSKKGRLSSWVPPVIIGREVVITLFRIYAGSRGSSVPASIWGKLKTNSQLLALLLVIMHGDGERYELIEKSSVALAVALTLYSGFDYITKAGKYLPQPEDGGDV
jgi:CDP-diacylglycerol--glycerol-3-phosphate 3-phosphatidyltransferase